MSYPHYVEADRPLKRRSGRVKVENVDNFICKIHMENFFIFRGSPEFDRKQNP